MPFVQLQVISAYSLLKSTLSIEKLVVSAKERGYKALALTDHNVMYGIVDFYKVCMKHNIKPILGITLDVQGTIDTQKEYPLILLAKNKIGYHNLMKLSSKKMLMEHDEPLNSEAIKEFSEGLIAITPGKDSEFELFLLNEEQESAKKVLNAQQKLFTSDSYFIGLHLHEKTEEIQAKLKALQSPLSIKTVALGDIHYLDPSDHFSNDVLKAIGSGEKVSLAEVTTTTGPHSLLEEKQQVEKFISAGLQKASEQTNLIAETINVEIELDQHLLPRFDVPEQIDTSTYLKELCFKGLSQRKPDYTVDYQERLEYELAIIHKMGFEDYFLIVWDLMAYAHKVGIVTGAGRGSAAGSLVSYVLSITDVDPIQYNLLFERFLNEERYTMPDIDLDFPDNRREEMLEYTKNKYGQEHVAQIATFGTLAAKMALRDVARVFELSQIEANEWSNTIPKTLGITLKVAYEQSKSLRELVQKNEKNTLLFDTAKKIEGLPRHVSTHAAGVVISDEPLNKYLPLQKGSSSIHLTQYPMGNVEEIGLLKMDFLGLKNLSIIDNTLKLIKKQTQEDVNLLAIPMNDSQTLELFAKADTVGIFQFESSGIKHVLRKLGPTSIEDVAAVNALYRPGPMEQIDLFIKRKKGEAPIVYPHDSLESILSVTYGVMVYQEQVMQVASKMAGYTLGQADILRRAMAKKKKSLIDSERTRFIKGAIALGYEEKIAAEVYRYIEQFANYGFNRSHAVAYSFIAYQMAYLKAHYPEAFFVALLNSASNNPAKLKEFALEIKKRKIIILAPDINTSFYAFSLKDHTIQFGLGSIKKLRRDMILDIIRIRKEAGPFKDLIDFLRRINPKWLKEEYIKPFIYVGAFDQLGYSRGTLAASLTGILSSLALSGNNTGLFDILKPKYTQTADLSLEEKLELEEFYLGVYLSGHPTEQYEKVAMMKQTVFIQDLQVGQHEKIIGLIKNVRPIRTKKGEIMAFVTLNDSSGDCSLTLFPIKYRQYGKLLEKGELLYVEGKVESSRDETKQLIVSSLEDVKVLVELAKIERVFIRIPAEKKDTKSLQELNQILKKHRGSIPVILFYEETKKKLVLNETEWVDGTQALKLALEKIIGVENVVIQKDSTF
ncbi:DNA polymerase III subunit alpha [Carnobacterium sp. TMP28]|uniref:DNA polymerase III subunit alpha n=1 Tax=Carnobacterium sp. TMP28 TaxID=3397060 RepID=UPI0039E18A38